MKITKRKKRLLIGGGLVVVVGVLAAMSLSGSDADVTEVQADLVMRDDLTEKVTASGRIEPKTKVDIVAQVSAQIHNVFVREGDWVEKGDPLILLDTVQLRADVAQARYSLDEFTARAKAARAQYQKDKLEFERQEALHQKGLTSETEYNQSTFTNENAKANHEAILAQVKTAKARLYKAKDNLQKTRIVAPMPGVVTYLNAEVGEIAQAQTSFTQGKTLLTVSDLSVFEVDVDVDETEVSKIVLDQTAEIRVDAFRDTTFEGTIVEIGNSAKVVGQGTESYTTSFRVKVRFDKAHDGIRPGMSATVDITTAFAENALLIPYASVVTREFDPDSLQAKTGSKDSGQSLVAEAHAEESDQENQKPRTYRKKEKVKMTGVFVIRDGKVSFIEITTDIADERNIVAMSGLAPGDTVVSGSYQTLRKLEDDDNVTIEESSMESMKEHDG